MAKHGIRFTLVHPSRPGAFVVLHLGKRLVTNSTSQNFRSVAAAAEHLERVLDLRKKDGFTLQSTEHVSAEEIEAAEAAEKLEVKKTGDRMVVTFREAVSGTDCSKLVRRLESEAPRFLQLSGDSASPESHWEKAIVGHQLSSVTAFVFDAPSQTQTRQGKNSIGDLSVTLDAMPSVQRVFVTGKLSLKACRHENLRELHLLGDPLPPASLKGLAGCEWPLLERLVISLAAEAGPSASRAALEALLGVRAPKLCEVHISGLADVAAALKWLTRADLPASLKILGLSGCLDEERLIECLRANATRLGELQTLALPLGDELSSEGAKTARQLHSRLQDTSEFSDATLPAAYETW